MTHAKDADRNDKNKRTNFGRANPTATLPTQAGCETCGAQRTSHAAHENASCAHPDTFSQNVRGVEDLVGLASSVVCRRRSRRYTLRAAGVGASSSHSSQDTDMKSRLDKVEPGIRDP